MSININKILKHAVDIYDYSFIRKIILDINPLLVHGHILDQFNIKHPIHDSFKNFTSHVDKLDYEIWINEKKSHFNNCIKIQEIDMDFTEQSELLFHCNGIDYYGYKKIVYNQILFLKEIIDIADFSDKIILNPRIQVDKYIMNMYIGSTYTNKIDLDKIKTSDNSLVL